MISENLASYEPDIAAEIDTEQEIIADEIGCTLAQARKVIAIRDRATRTRDGMMLGVIIGILIDSGNLPVMVRALAMAAGLDQLNGEKSEAEAAKKLGVTRALLSHYVIGWRDALSGRAYSFDVTKFRKANGTRAIYAEKATMPIVGARARSLARHRNATIGAKLQQENTPRPISKAV